MIKFGNMTNFVGMINIDDPFNNKLPFPNGLFDEVHDAKWYHDTIKFVMLKLKENCIYCFQSLATLTKQELM